MEKYRCLNVHCEHCFDVCLLTRIIQVKKWYGWVTIYTIEAPYDEAVEKTDKILKLLKNEIY